MPHADPEVRREYKRRWEARTLAHRRERLIEKLGGECMERGRGPCKGPLEFDHIEGATWLLRGVSSLVRMKRYEAEAEQYLIQLLCRRHNVAKGGSSHTRKSLKRRKR